MALTRDKVTQWMSSQIRTGAPSHTTKGHKADGHNQTEPLIKIMHNEKASLPHAVSYDWISYSSYMPPQRYPVMEHSVSGGWRHYDPSTWPHTRPRNHPPPGEILIVTDLLRSHEGVLSRQDSKWRTWLAITQGRETRRRPHQHT